MLHRCPKGCRAHAWGVQLEVGQVPLQLWGILRPGRKLHPTLLARVMLRDSESSPCSSDSLGTTSVLIPSAAGLTEKPAAGSALAWFGFL